jgi:hypothetical protein
VLRTDPLNQGKIVSLWARVLITGESVVGRLLALLVLYFTCRFAIQFCACHEPLWSKKETFDRASPSLTPGTYLQGMESKEGA